MSQKSRLDRIDFDILGALQNDARLSNKELAALVGLAPSSCLERVRRLRAVDALRGFHADVNPRMLGIGLQALIAIRIQKHARALIQDFQQHALGLREVVGLYHVAGANDFLVHVAVRDTDHLRQFAIEAFTTRPEVEHMETSLVFGHEHAKTLPNYATDE